MNQTRTDTAVTPDLEKEIQKHHRSLKQFIDVSYDSAAPVRKNSKRATKAREKLLKLSQAQFIELSTDVYDELHRRINESKEEPDHLLPRKSFHPKRNQAREKLASLPAQRFKDLVNDILYEIERRYLHISKTPEPENEYGGDSNNNNRVGSTDSTLQAAQHGVQSKTVIPTKATMAWSSDEEDNGPEEDFAEEAARPSSFVEPLERRSEDYHTQNLDRNGVDHQHRSFQTDDDVHQFESFKRDDGNHQEAADVVPEMISVKSPSPNKHTSSSSIKRGMSINKDREIQMLLEEGTKMDGKITDLEKALETERQKVFDLRNENSALLEQIDMNKESHEAQITAVNRQLNEAPSKNQHVLLQSQYDALQSSHAIISDKHDALLDDLDRLKKENEDLKMRQASLQNSRDLIPGSDSSTDVQLQELQEKLYQLAQAEAGNQVVDNSDELKAQSDNWRKRYEEARSDHFYEKLNKADLSDATFQQFVSDSGAISMKKLADFQESVESFYLEFNKPEHDKNELFKSVSMIATKADSMCSDVNAENKISSIVKACITHSIVVARHYLTYQNILPSIVLNIAVNDVALAVCDLIKSVKLTSSGNGKALGIRTAEHSTPIAQDFNAPSSFLNVNDTSSPVRPLRMIERLNSPGIGGATRSFENDRATSSNNDSVQQKRAALATSALAPIVTQVASTPDVQSQTERVKHSEGPVVSPRGPGIISLAGKYGNSVADKEVDSTPKASPTSRNILERVRKFESPEAEVAPSKKALPQISTSNTDGFAKFGARRRSSLGDANSVVSNGAAPGLSNETHATVSNGGASVVNKVDTPDNALYAAAPIIKSDGNITNGTGLKSRDFSTSETNSHDIGQPLKPVTETSKSSHYDTNVDLNEIPSVQQSDYEEKASVEIPSNPPNSQFKNSDSKPASITTNDPIAEMEQDKAAVAANFHVEDFNILNPDNTLHELLLYLEHQTMDVISTIQTLLASIKKQDSTRGVLRDSAKAINIVVGQMTEATNISMSQTRNVQLREHGSWVVQNLEDCGRRMDILCGANNKASDADYADKNFKQRLAGVAFDIAKSTKELVKSVEEASLKQEIALLDARLGN